MVTSTWQEAPFELGPWRVVPRRRSLSDGDYDVSLEPKVMQVLLCLVECSGQVVTRTEIMEAVWGDVVVGDEVLTRAISELRRALADDAKQPRYIETVPKVGYRLVADVLRSQAAFSAVSVVQAQPSAKPFRIRWGLISTGLLGLLALVFGILREHPLRPDSQHTLLQATPFTSFPGMEIDPAFSPDGSRIAFARQTPTSAGWHLFMKGLGAEAILALTDEASGMSERLPTWSPDGTQIAFVRYAESDCGIYTVSVLGGSSSERVTCSPSASIFGLAWAHDGQTLVYAEQIQETGVSRLRAFALDTHERRLLTDSQAFIDKLPAVSPDGEQVAFVRMESPGVADIYRLPITGGRPERLTTVRLSINGLTWTPDSQHLVFSSYHGSNYNLWQVPSGGGEVRLLATGHGSISSPTLDANQGLVYVRWSHDTNVWRMETEGASEAVLISTQADLLPQFAPDGDHLAFVSERSGLPELWVGGPDGSRAAQVTTQGSYFNGPIRWSPDGKSIAYARAVNGQLDIYVADVNKGVVRQITKDAAVDVAPFWSPDGQWLYFGSNRAGRWNLWKISSGTAGGRAVSVPHAEGMIGQMAPDGQYLYFVRPDTTGIWRMPVDGEQVDFLPVPLNNTEDLADWVVTETGIYFVMRNHPVPSSIAFYDFGSGAITMHPTSNVISRNSGLTLSPDRQWVYYTQVDRSESDLMIAPDIFSSLYP